MIKVIFNGATVKVHNVELFEGSRAIFVARNPVTHRLLNAYPFLELTGEKDASGHDLLRIKEDSGAALTGNYRNAKKEPKREQQRKESEDVQQEAPRDSESNEAQQESPKNAAQSPKENATANGAGGDDVAQLAAILARMKGGNVDTDTVRAIVREELANVKPTKVEHVVKVADLPERKVEGFVSPLFDTVLRQVANDRLIGRFPWLYGAAGSGKSTMAAQVAQALNLPFYCVSSMQQKYELEGYADAGGNFVETSFYKAFRYGGVFCFDEASTASAEVQVAFNTALAQLKYNFPVVGMVEAHPDFHVIAADNTCGRGGNKTYSARFALDSSTLDRYTFIEVGYSAEFDLFMAQQDAELVALVCDIREALKQANSTYLCTPRAIKAVKALQAIGYSDREALEVAIFGGWDAQTKRTIINAISERSERYYCALDSLIY